MLPSRTRSDDPERISSSSHGLQDHRILAKRYAPKPPDFSRRRLAKDTVPSLAAFSAIAIVRHQDQFVSLAGVPWDPCGKLIWELLHERHMLPTGDLLSAFLEEYPHLREQNSTLFIRGSLQQDSLSRLSSANSPVSRYLVHLNLSGSSFNDEMTCHIAHLSNLRFLDISKTAVGDNGLMALLRPTMYNADTDEPCLRSLQCLNISHTCLSDACIPYLVRTPTLDALDVSGSHVSLSSLFLRYGWIRLPKAVPVFNFQTPMSREELTLLLRAEGADPDIRVNPDIIMRAWMEPDLVAAAARSEMWHYVMGIPLGRSLPPCHKQRKDAMEWGMRLVKLGNKSSLGQLPASSAEGNKEDRGLAVRKRKWIADYPSVAGPKSSSPPANIHRTRPRIPKGIMHLAAIKRR
ncbi:hypothetical protein SpCBS45565_g02759 [Spizellomyces sp. 'palustris']|nr:hypothetical protein SpCBS45565_g02759 [Spizellomyces sp. 'palustris']